VSTLAQIRAALNADMGIATDAETAPWSVTARNAAIAAGYQELGRKGATKPVVVSVNAVTDKQYYLVADGITGIEELSFVDVVNSLGQCVDHPQAILEADGAGTFQLVTPPIATGYTLKLHGFKPYICTFAGDSSPDDLESQYQRVPLLKAKAILLRQTSIGAARYNQRQLQAPTLNATLDQILGMISLAEREFETALKDMLRHKTVYAQPSRRRA
jgi:hypothetical protein